MDQEKKDVFMEIIKKNFSKEEMKKYETLNKDLSFSDVEFAEEKAQEELKLFRKSLREFNDKIKPLALHKELKWAFLHMAESLVTLEDIIEFKDRKKIIKHDKDTYMHIQIYRSKLFSEILKKYRRDNA